MARTTDKKGYKPTESQYKGGADEMYVTYDIEQKTRGNNKARYPKAKRVYIAGDIKKWEIGLHVLHRPSTSCLEATMSIASAIRVSGVNPAVRRY